MKVGIQACLIILAGMLVATSVFAETRVDGYTLHKDCGDAMKLYSMSPKEREKVPQDMLSRSLQCVEYITGMIDGVTINNIFYAILHDDLKDNELTKYHAICVPSIDVKEAVEIVYNFMNKNAQYLNKPRFMIVGRALYEAFPPGNFCTKEFYKLAREE